MVPVVLTTSDSLVLPTLEMERPVGTVVLKMFSLPNLAITAFAMVPGLLSYPMA